MLLIVSMDTLPSSVSTLKVQLHHPTPRELYHFKASTTSSHQLPPHHSNNLTSTTKPKITSASFTQKNHNNFPLLTSSGSSSPKPEPPATHRKAASGYAAALLDKALCQGSLEAVQRDVHRLSRLLKNEQIQALLIDPLVGEKEKGELVNEVVKIGNFNRYLAGVLRMLIERNKVGMVSEVLDEFGRIYDLLIGTRVVFVSSVKKIEENELYSLAKKVQKFNGAAKVKIKNFVDDGAPSFAE